MVIVLLFQRLARNEGCKGMQTFSGHSNGENQVNFKPSMFANFGGFASEFQPRPGSHPTNIGQLQYPQNEEKPYDLRSVDPTL